MREETEDGAMSISRDLDREPGRRVWVSGLAAVAVQVVVALLTVAAKWPKGDTELYFRYATLAFAGKLPYRDYPVEYPLLALPLFLVPRAVAPGLAGFQVAFAVEMLLFNAVTVLLVASWIERTQGQAQVRSGLAWYTLSFVMLSRLVVSRYDAAPMFLGFGASICWFSGRAGMGALAASLGALMKVYPAVIPLLATIHDLGRPRRGAMRASHRTLPLTKGELEGVLPDPCRSTSEPPSIPPPRGGKLEMRDAPSGKGVAVFALTTLLGLAAWLFLGGASGVATSLRYQLGRGFEYGSVASGVQMLAAKLVGAPIVIARDHASFSTITPWSPFLTSLVLPIQAMTLMLIGWVFARRGMTEGVRYSGAAVLALIVTGKVFSPQYLIWLMPYIAVLEGPIARRGRRLFALVCLTTLLAGTGLLASRTDLSVILLYNSRNALIVWLLILLVFGTGTGQTVDNE